MKIRSVANGNVVDYPEGQARALIAAGIYEAVDEKVNIKHPDFGAVGDGVADDTAAIQAAVTAVTPLTTEMVPVAVWADPPPKPKRLK